MKNTSILEGNSSSNSQTSFAAWEVLIDPYHEVETTLQSFDSFLRVSNSAGFRWDLVGTAIGKNYKRQVRQLSTQAHLLVNIMPCVRSIDLEMILFNCVWMKSQHTVPCGVYGKNFTGDL